MPTVELATDDFSCEKVQQPGTRTSITQPSGFLLAWAHPASSEGIPGGTFATKEQAVTSIPTFLAVLLQHCPSETSVRAILSGRLVVSAAK